MLGTILLVLSVLVSGIVYGIYQQQKHERYKYETQRIHAELELIGDFLGDAMSRHDYIEAKQLLARWFNNHQDISLFQATFTNGQPLFHQQRGGYSEQDQVDQLQVHFSDNELQLKLAYLSRDMHASLRTLQQQLLGFSLIMVLLTGGLLWYLLFRWTLRPMEAEVARRTQDLSQSLSFLDSMLDATATQIVIVDHEGVIVTTNRAWRENNPQLEQASYGVGRSFFEIYPASWFGQGEENYGRQGIEQVLRGERQRFVLEYECSYSKARRWYSLRAYQVPWQGPPRVVISQENITNIKLVQAALEANQKQLETLNRHYRLVSQCHIAVAQSVDEEALLKEICHIIAHQGGYSLVWIGMAEQGGEQRVIPVAWHGFEQSYMEKLCVRWDDSLLGRGPAGRAIRENRPVIVDDIETDPRFKPWLNSAKSQNFSTCASFPLGDESGSFGVLSLYSQQQGVFGPDESMLFSELASTLSQGLYTLRGQARLKLNRQTTLTFREEQAR
ncbi:GAF domain-containing protein [Magnetococcus marinus]|nr:GAF domain-containing protein [Magnetococcus marinus]